MSKILSSLPNPSLKITKELAVGRTPSPMVLVVNTKKNHSKNYQQLFFFYTKNYLKLLETIKKKVLLQTKFLKIL